MALRTDDIPDLSGKTIVVTGANSGIGHEAARMFARKGGDVILACRSRERGEAAVQRIRTETPLAKLEFLPLDLSSLRSVHEFAARVLQVRPRLDALVNNAGLMAIPRRLTEDGFEMQLGVNHFGHFALTGLLLPRLLATTGARVINVSSMASAIGHMDFDDLDGARRYRKWPAYAQSKLANLLFTFELARRLADKRADVCSIACHPGYAATNLQFVGPQMEDSFAGKLLMQLGNSLIAQSAEAGALPTVYAAVDPAARSGDFIGPSGPLWRGAPRPMKARRNAYDRAAMQRLWQISVERTSVDYAALA